MRNLQRKEFLKCWFYLVSLKNKSKFDLMLSTAKVEYSLLLEMDKSVT